jgi:hypothetical protein
MRWQHDPYTNQACVHTAVPRARTMTMQKGVHT